MRRCICSALLGVAVCVASGQEGIAYPAQEGIPYPQGYYPPQPGMRGYPPQQGKGGYPGRMNPSYPQPGYPQYGPPKPPEPLPEVEVVIYDNYFKPAEVHVTPGGVVRFVNKGRHKHTITALTGKWDSGDLAPGKTYTFAIKVNLNHFYYCRHHPLTMNGKIVVREAPKGGGGPPSGY